MKDVNYWESTLPNTSILQGIAQGTSILRHPRIMGSNSDDNMPNNTHGAAGQGPFGQLTMLGLLQMIKLGERLRGELVGNIVDDEEYNHLFSKPEELHNPRYIQVMSTDFPRTIQSVQAMLTGLHDNSNRNKDDQEQMMIEIDVRDTNTYFIPDPQPRQHNLQLELEKQLANRPHLREREIGLQDLARRVTDELEIYLGDGADGISFGIGEEKDISASESAAASIGVGKHQQQRRPLLAWAQMCEILVCLHSRNLLPSTITKDDVTTVSNHVAWRWFENLGHPILAKAAMTKFTNVLIDTMRRRVHEDKVVVGATTNNSVVVAASPPDHIHEHVVPRLCIYSAHDSTLIGLLCVLQLERPTVWPEYGSALKVELLREEKETTAVAQNNGGGDDDDIKYWVRFSLNGEVLRCNTTGLTENENDDNDDESSEASMVSFDRLVEMINSDYDDKELKYSWTNGLLSQN
jgi:acid phosphatase